MQRFDPQYAQQPEKSGKERRIRGRVNDFLLVHIGGPLDETQTLRDVAPHPEVAIRIRNLWDLRGDMIEIEESQCDGEERQADHPRPEGSRRRLTRLRPTIRQPFLRDR